MSDTPDSGDSMHSKRRRTAEYDADAASEGTRRTTSETARSNPSSRREYLALLAALPAAGTGLAATSGTAVADTHDSEQLAGYGANGFGAAGYGAASTSESSPTTCAYTSNAGTVETDNLRTAIDDWRNDEITTDLLREVIAMWRSGESVSECT